MDKLLILSIILIEELGEAIKELERNNKDGIYFELNDVIAVIDLINKTQQLSHPIHTGIGVDFARHWVSPNKQSKEIFEALYTIHHLVCKSLRFGFRSAFDNNGRIESNLDAIIRASEIFQELDSVHNWEKIEAKQKRVNDLMPASLEFWK